MSMVIVLLRKYLVVFKIHCCTRTCPTFTDLLKCFIIFMIAIILRNSVYIISSYCLGIVRVMKFTISRLLSFNLDTSLNLLKIEVPLEGGSLINLKLEYKLVASK